MTAVLSQRDRELLAAWIHGPTSTSALAAELGIEVPDLTAWAARPEIAAAIRAIREFTLARAQTFALAAKSAAVARLLQIVEHADDEQSARRAATAILRFNPRAPGPAPDPAPPANEFHGAADVPPANAPHSAAAAPPANALQGAACVPPAKPPSEPNHARNRAGRDPTPPSAGATAKSTTTAKEPIAQAIGCTTTARSTAAKEQPATARAVGPSPHEPAASVSAALISHRPRAP